MTGSRKNFSFWYKKVTSKPMFWSASVYWLLWRKLCVICLTKFRTCFSDNRFNQHSWIRQHCPALEWRPEELQRIWGLCARKVCLTAFLGWRKFLDCPHGLASSNTGSSWLSRLATIWSYGGPPQSCLGFRLLMAAHTSLLLRSYNHTVAFDGRLQCPTIISQQSATFISGCQQKCPWCIMDLLNDRGIHSPQNRSYNGGQSHGDLLNNQGDLWL